MDPMKPIPALIALPQRTSLVKQVTETLRAGLARGLWQERLPGERDLCQQLNVSRPTLRAALTVLEREGWLKSAPGCVRAIVQRARGAAGPGTSIVRLLVPFRLQEAPQSIFYWVDKLRTLLPAAGCALEIHSGPRWYAGRPEQELAQLARQMPAAAWVVARTTEPMQRWFAAQGLPCVVAGSCYPGVNLPSADFDHRAVAQHAARQLLARGHRRLALLIQTPEMAGDLESEAGFNEVFPPGAPTEAGGADGAA